MYIKLNVCLLLKLATGNGGGATVVFGMKALLFLLRLNVRIRVEQTEQGEYENALNDAEHEEEAWDAARGHQPDVEQVEDGACDLYDLLGDKWR